MVLSKRERYVGIVTGAVIAILVIDWLAVSPLLERKKDLDARIETAEHELEKANRLFNRSRRDAREWASMTGATLRRDASEAESQILNNVRQWAQDSGLTLSSVKPERTEKEKEFQKATFRAIGTGSMRQVGEFLWRMQTASLPVRVTDMVITSKDGTDELSVNLALATIYLAPQPPPDGPGRSGAAPSASAWEVRQW